MGNPVLWLPSPRSNLCDIVSSSSPYLSSASESCHSLFHSSSSSFEHYLPELQYPASPLTSSLYSQLSSPPSIPTSVSPPPPPSSSSSTHCVPFETSFCHPCETCCSSPPPHPNSARLPPYLSSSSICLSSLCQQQQQHQQQPAPASSISLSSSSPHSPASQSALLSMGFEARPRSRLPMPIHGSRLVEPYTGLDTPKPSVCVRATKRIGVPVMPLPRSKSFHQLLRSTQNGQILASRGTIRGNTGENAPRTTNIKISPNTSNNNSKNILLNSRLPITKNHVDIIRNIAPKADNSGSYPKCNTFSKKTAAVLLQNSGIKVPNGTPNSRKCVPVSSAPRKAHHNDSDNNNANNKPNIRMKVTGAAKHQTAATTMAPNYAVNQCHNNNNNKSNFVFTTNTNELTTKLPQVSKARPESIVVEAASAVRRLHQSDTNLSSKQAPAYTAPDIVNGGNMIVITDKVHHQIPHNQLQHHNQHPGTTTTHSVPQQMPRKSRTTIPQSLSSASSSSSSSGASNVTSSTSTKTPSSSSSLSTAAVKSQQSSAPMRAVFPIAGNRSVSHNTSPTTVTTTTTSSSSASMVVQHYSEPFCGRQQHQQQQKRINQSISCNNSPQYSSTSSSCSSSSASSASSSSSSSSTSAYSSAASSCSSSTSSSSFTPLFINVTSTSFTVSNTIFTSTATGNGVNVTSSSSSSSTSIRSSFRKTAVRSSVQSRANVNGIDNRNIGLSTPDLAKTNEQKCQLQQRQQAPHQNRNKIKRSVSSFDGGSYLSRLRNNLTSGLSNKPTVNSSLNNFSFNNSNNKTNLNKHKTRSATPTSSLSSLVEAQMTPKTESPWKLRRPKPSISSGGLDGCQSQYMSFEFLNERITSRLQREFDYYNGQLQQFGTISSVSALSGVGTLEGSGNDCSTRERSASLSHGAGSVGTNSMTNSSADDDNETDTSRSTISNDSSGDNCGANKTKTTKLGKKKSFRKMLENYFVNSTDTGNSSSESNLSQIHNLRTNSKLSFLGDGSYQRQTEHLFGRSKENFLLKRTTPNAGLKESLRRPTRLNGPLTTSGPVTQFPTVTNRQLEIFENILRQTLMANSFGDDKETVKNFGLVSSSKFILEDQKMRENNAARNDDSLENDNGDEIECDSILGLDDILALESPISSRRSSVERFEIDVENELQDYRCFWVPLNDLTSESDPELDDKSLMTRLSINSNSIVSRSFLEHANIDEILAFDITARNAVNKTENKDQNIGNGDGDEDLTPLPNAAFFTLSNQLKTLLYNSNRWKSTNVYFNY